MTNLVLAILADMASDVTLDMRQSPEETQSAIADASSWYAPKGRIRKSVDGVTVLLDRVTSARDARYSLAYALATDAMRWTYL